jgi:hypothetical protein
MGSLSKLMNGSPTKLIINTGESVSPRPGSAWLILSGTIAHTNLTASQIWIDDKQAATPYNWKETIFWRQVAAAVVAVTIPLFGNDPSGTLVADTQGMGWQPIIIQNGQYIHMAGGAASGVVIEVLEYPV